MSARRGPNITPISLYAYKPAAGPLASERQGSVWICTSTYKWMRWDTLRQVEQSAIIETLLAMGLSFGRISMAANGTIPWPHWGTPWSVWIPQNTYKRVMETQKGAK